jgi:uncharacterized protein (AIM24 family)
MATFKLEHSEGMRWVKVTLDDDDVRTERGALNHMQGEITMDVPWPTLKAWWVSLFSDESLLRPRYHGTGNVYLDSSLGGYHVMQVVPGERWILDTKCFWASDGEVQLTDKKTAPEYTRIFSAVFDAHFGLQPQPTVQ